MRARPAASLAAAILLVAVTATAFVPLMYARMRRPQGNDLTVYLRSAEALRAGRDPYAIDVPQGHGPYPLTLDALAIPLTRLPAGLAQALWFMVNAGALVGSLGILDRLWRRAEAGANAALALPFTVRLAVVVLALLVPLQSDFTRGQANLLVLLLACLFLQAHLADRAVAAGLWLGGGIALKLTPLVFTVELIRRRRYRTLAMAGVGLILGAIVLPALASGHVLVIYRDGWTRSLDQEIGGPVSFNAWSRFTLAAALARIWPPISAIPGYRYFVGFIVLAALAWIAGRARDDRDRLLVFALGLVVIPLLSPKSENHHLALLAGTLWIWLLAAGSSPRRPVLDVAGAVLFLALAWTGARQPASLLDFLALSVLAVVLAARVPGRAASPVPT